MPGNFNPSPLTTGAEKGRLEEVLLADGLDADGTALAKDVDSFVWAERNAEARALAYLWHLNRRMANQWDPRRMTDFLPRWEKILGLRPLAGATDVARRAAVLAKMQLFGQPGTQQVLTDLLHTLFDELGIFVGIVNTSSAVAVGTVPGGATVPGGVTLPDGDWYSSIAHLAIETVQPDGVDDPTFYDAVGQIAQAIDGIVPAWVTFDWFLDGSHGAGFYLDEEKNLDNQRFD